MVKKGCCAIESSERFVGVTKARDMNAWWKRHHSRYKFQGWWHETFKHSEPVKEQAVRVDMRNLDPYGRMRA